MESYAGKYTRGKWRMSPKHNAIFTGDIEHYVIHSEMDTIAVVSHWSNEPAEAKANCNLIQAAPDIFEALRALVTDWDEKKGSNPDTPRIIAARKALKLALGQ